MAQASSNFRSHSMPLPTSPPSHFSPEQCIAYDRCKRYELSQAPGIQTSPDNSQYFQPIVAARVLGWMLVYAPCSEGRAALAEDICNCQNEEALYDLAITFKYSLLRCFLAARGRTPTPSLQPSAPLLTLPPDILEDNIQEPPQDHSTAKRQALERDGYRCLLQPSVLHQAAAAYGAFPDRRGCRLEYLQCAHIFPPSTMRGMSDTDKKVYATTALGMFRRYGNVDVTDFLTGQGDHHLRNIMSLCASSHEDFDRMNICLVATDEDNRYDLKVFPDYLIGQYPPSVVLKERTVEVDIRGSCQLLTFPKPDPKLLALHASCAHVIHMSGAAEHLQQVLEDMEETKMLSTDGGSAKVLVDALFCLPDTSTVLAH